MKFVSKILVAVACAAVLAPAMAQEKRSSLSISGNYSKAADSDGNASVNISYGYLLTPQIEIGVYDFFMGSDAFLMNSLGGEVQYYFRPVGKVNSFNPYIKVNAGTSVMESDSTDALGRKTTNSSTGTAVGAFIGVSNPLSETTDFFVEAGTQSVSYSGTSSSSTEARFGLKVRF